MRVIAQYGTIDIPYEQVTIQRHNKSIYFMNANISDEEHVYMFLASYSSEEKAKKAMDMMEEQYSAFEVVKLLLPCYGERFLIGYKQNPKHNVIKELSRFDVFRFPMDDEISI